MTVVTLLIVISLILLGAAVGKPMGWLAIGFAVLALLLSLFGGPIRVGVVRADGSVSIT